MRIIRTDVRGTLTRVIVGKFKMRGKFKAILWHQEQCKTNTSVLCSLLNLINFKIVFILGLITIFILFSSFDLSETENSLAQFQKSRNSNADGCIPLPSSKVNRFPLGIIASNDRNMEERHRQKNLAFTRPTAIFRHSFSIQLCQMRSQRSV